MQMYSIVFQQTITHVEETNRDTHLSKVLEHSAALAGCKGCNQHATPTNHVGDSGSGSIITKGEEGIS